MKTQGKFFVIEGTNGAGKGTQFELLAKRLTDEGYDVVTFDFPQYNQDSSYFVRQYLSGAYGTAQEVGPYTASVFYAFDRYSAKQNILRALEQGKIVLANRFSGSNMAHQGTKFVHPEERRGYFIWLDNLEFQMLGIPRPAMSFVLRVDAETSMKLVDERAEQDATRSKDLHEQDEAHVRKSVEVYDDLCALFPKDFHRIDCVRSKKLLSREQIHDLLWSEVEKQLPDAPKAKGKGKRQNGSEMHQDYVYKDETDIYHITKAGEDFLKSAVTSLDSNVYAFTDAMSPITIAAAMARLSRRGDDMRITILDEFGASAAKKDEKLLQRVITAYGDDSVQQLVGQHLVVENASNLLTKKLEWGRLAAYLEQSTRYIYFDQKDTQGNYRYYTPELPEKISKRYKTSMDAIFGLYSDMVRQLTDYVRSNSTVPKAEQDIAWQGATRAQACDAIRPVLPVATTATVGIFASGQALESLIMHLLGDELPEARTTGEKVLEESRKVVNTFLERADKPDRGGATIAYNATTRAEVRKRAQQYLSAKKPNSFKEVDLVSVWPRNELDIVPNILYEHSNMSLRDITTQVEKLDYDAKVDILKSAFGERLNRRHKPSRALEKIHYSWDLVCDYGIFRDLQRHRIVDDLNWQLLTPDYGYDIPDLVEKAGLSEQFKQCFEIAEELYDMLASSVDPLIAQYATLLGHKMRWKITYNARQAFHFHELRTTPHGHPGYRRLVGMMHEKLTEVHPLIGDAMKFVNQDEDPELTRLAAERATQFKLSQMD